jgi:hypothetical protein
VSRSSQARFAHRTRAGAGGVGRPATFALAVAVLVATASGARARDLGGRICLGDGLRVVIDLKEGLFSEVLRKIGLRSTPRSRVDLTRLGASAGDRVFVGTDFGFYCDKAADGGAAAAASAYKIGSAVQLWDIRTGPGVTLQEVTSVVGHMVGDAASRLKIAVAGSPAKAADVEPAGIRFWLDEIVYQHDNPGRRRGKIDNFTVIVSAVMGALPDQEGDPRERFDNLNALVRFVRQAKDSDLVPLRDLLRLKISRLRDGLKDGRISADRSAEVLKGYEDLRAQIDRRRDDS